MKAHLEQMSDYNNFAPLHLIRRDINDVFTVAFFNLYHGVHHDVQ